MDSGIGFMYALPGLLLFLGGGLLHFKAIEQMHEEVIFKLLVVFLFPRRKFFDNKGWEFQIYGKICIILVILYTKYVWINRFVQ